MYSEEYLNDYAVGPDEYAVGPDESRDYDSEATMDYEDHRPCPCTSCSAIRCHMERHSTESHPSITASTIPYAPCCRSVTSRASQAATHDSHATQTYQVWVQTEARATEVNGYLSSWGSDVREEIWAQTENKEGEL